MVQPTFRKQTSQFVPRVLSVPTCFQIRFVIILFMMKDVNVTKIFREGNKVIEEKNRV